MSFWNSRTGDPITGDEKSSFSSNNNFKHIPDGTTLNAMIINASHFIYEGEIKYQFIFKAIDGDFQGDEIKKVLSPYDLDDKKAQKSLNIFKRMYILCDLKPTHSDAPTDEDLCDFKFKTLSLKIGNNFINGKEVTWISEFYAQDHFKPETGLTINTEKYKSELDSALTRNSKKNATDLDDDLPF